MAPSGKNGTTSLDVKIEVVRVQLAALDKTVIESRDETRAWRIEMKAEAASSTAAFAALLTKHEASDDHKHNALETSIARLENQTLDAGKMMIARVELLEKTVVGREGVSAVERHATEEARAITSRVDALEKRDVAKEAVDAYKKWFIGTAVAAVLSTALMLAQWFKLITISFRP